MAKQKYQLTSHIDNLKFRELSDRIKAMSDISELTAMCRVDADMARFCGVSHDMNEELMLREAGEQWRACRKGK